MAISAPTARYVVAVDDQTKATLASIRSNFKSLDSGVRSVARGLNLSLGVLAGVGLKSMFRNVLDATAEAAGAQSGFAKALDSTRAAARNLMAAKDGLPGATKSLQELTDILKDPTVMSAADALMSALVRGFAATAKYAAETVAGMRIILTGNGGNAIVDADSKVRKLEGRAQFFENDDTQSGRQKYREIQRELRKARADYQSAVAGDPLVPVDNTGQQVLNAIFDSYEEGLERAKKATEALKEAQAEAFERSFDPLRAEIAVRKEIDDGVKKSLQETADATEDVNKILVEATEGTMEKVKEAFTEMSEFAKQAARNMQDALADFLFDPFKDGLDGMLRGFLDIIRRMIAEAAAADIFEAITGGAGGNLSKIFKGVGAFFGGFKAAGGPVSGGRSYVVGERGPELFTPDGSGFITPNGGGGSAIHIHNHVDARGSTTDFAKALPGILEASNRRAVEQARAVIKDDISRGALRV